MVRLRESFRKSPRTTAKKVKTFMADKSSKAEKSAKAAKQEAGTSVSAVPPAAKRRKI
jgi:hypothetical protein